MQTAPGYYFLLVSFGEFVSRIFLGSEGGWELMEKAGSSPSKLQ
jgi:hypothetical protein